MSWIGPTAKKAITYGPQAKIAWDKAGKPAAAVAAKKGQQQLQKRKAFAKAATLVDGSVLRQMHAGEPVYVVLTHGEPVEAFPPVDIDLTTLVKDADPTRAVSSADYEQKRLTTRLKAARPRKKS